MINCNALDGRVAKHSKNKKQNMQRHRDLKQHNIYLENDERLKMQQQEYVEWQGRR